MKIGIRTLKLAAIAMGSFLVIGLACKSGGSGDSNGGAGGAEDTAGAGGSENEGGAGGTGGSVGQGGGGVGAASGETNNGGSPSADGSAGSSGSGGKADAGIVKDGAADAGVSDARSGDATGDLPAGGIAKYDFELNTQLWGDLRDQSTVVSRSMDQHFSNQWSLKVELSTRAPDAGVDAGDDQFLRNVGVGGGDALPMKKGSMVTFHVWIPANHGLLSVQPYVMDDAFSWTGAWTPAAALVAGGWSTLTIELPANFTKVLELGVEFGTNGPWTGTVYVDAITW